MTRKRYQKLVRAWVTNNKEWIKEPIGKTYKRIRNVKIDWNKYRKNFTDNQELTDMMMYNCSLYLRDYGCNYDIRYIL